MMAGGSMRLLVALLLAPLALTGQADGVSIPNQPPAAPAPQYRPEDLCSVEGQVVNSETGGPVNKASLALFPMANGAGRAALSDASGRFAFQNVSPGTYRTDLRLQSRTRFGGKRLTG